MAYSMGRTLVLPPSQKIYLLGKDRDRQKTTFNFGDFFHLESLNIEHDGLNIITMENFLRKEAMGGNLHDSTTGKVSYPPGNVTDWSGKNMMELNLWLRTVTHVPIWRPGECLLVVPSSSSKSDLLTLNKTFSQIINNTHVIKKLPRYIQHPIRRKSQEFSQRAIEALVGRRKICIYDHELQNAPILHFMCDHKRRVRLLVHFYAFLFFENWKVQAWSYRFVRDHLRYIDELQCAAARIVQAIQKRVHINDNEKKYVDNSTEELEFDSFHIRRGDFQYKKTRIDADLLYNNSKDKIPEDSIVYVATDEQNKSFFDPMKEHYNLLFLDDFKHLLHGLNSNYYGMIDQLVASKGRTFFGTYYSTFSGYINRMRGYHVQKRKMEGYKDGTINSYYFFPNENKYEMRKYAIVRQPFFSREFPTSWWDIDVGVGELMYDFR